MLTKRDLRWTWKLFSLFSKLMWIPVTFKPVMSGGHGSQMESGDISIWRRIGFKIVQVLFMCQSLFVTIRTLEYVSYGNSGFFGEKSDDADLDWDYVPILLCFTASYLSYNAVAYLIFHAGRELNTKVFNEFIRLLGKTNSQRKSLYLVSLVNM